MTEIERAYPPSENEAMNALWQQGLAVMKFYADPTMTVTDLNQTVESILFDLKILQGQKNIP